MSARHIIFAVFVAGAAAVAGVAIDPAPVSGYNHVQNGGFESGADGWSISPNADLTVVGGEVVPPAEGSQAARITLTGGSFTLRQTSRLGTTAGPYATSLRVRTSSSSIYVEAGVSSQPSQNEVSFAIPPSAPNRWVAVTTDVQITGFTNIVIWVRGTGVAGDVVYIDDVRFDGAPPATMTPTHTFTPLPSATPGAPTRTPSPTKTVRPPGTAAAGTPEIEATAAAEVAALAPGFGRLINGGFEDLAETGTPVAWAKYGGGLSTSTSPVRSGRRSIRFESATESTKWVFQTVRIDPGGGYAFDAWVWHADPGIAAAFLRVSWYASDDGSGEAISTADSTGALDTPATGWRYLTTEGIAAPGDARSARVRVMLKPASAAPAALYVDDASFGPSDTVALPAVAGVADDKAAAPATGRSAETRSSPARAFGGSRRSSSARRVASAAVSAPAAAGSRVVINEVLYDAGGDDADADGEWIELYNAGAEAASLAGWSILDNRSADVLPAFVLAPGEYAIIASTDALLAAHPELRGRLRVVGRLGNALGNEGDRILLFDGAGRFVDTVSWGTDTSALNPAATDVPAGHSIERRPAGTDTGSASDFVDNESPSPGGPYPSSPRAASAARGGTTVEVLASKGSDTATWLGWGFAAASSLILLGVVSWRALPALRRREQ